MAAKFRLEFSTPNDEPIAQIGFRETHGGLREGEPLLTPPCESFVQFANEIEQLHRELDRVQAEAKEKFSSTHLAKGHQSGYVRLLKNIGQKNMAKFSVKKRNK